MARMKPLDTDLTAALAGVDTSTRLRAGLAIGSDPDPQLVDVLVARCALEPDFYVRDMLTWALHTLSKIKDAAAWPAITRSLLRDSDDEVARAAWRAAVILVPDAEKKSVAEELAGQLGRGDRHVQLSLSRALVALGADCRACAPARAGERQP